MYILILLLINHSLLRIIHIILRYKYNRIKFNIIKITVNLSFNNPQIYKFHHHQ